MVSPNINKFDENEPDPTSPKKSVWFKGPLLMYITMVTMFLIIAVFVIHYIIEINGKTL